jgi:hypothetical protein
MDAVGGVHDEHGHYGLLVYAGIESSERAKEIKQALFRSGYHLKVSVSANIVKGTEDWQVHFKAIDKVHARKYILETYGPDRSAWAYDPRAKKEKE